MPQGLFRITPSGAIGLLFAIAAFVFIPMVAGALWLSVFTSTTCFALAMAGVSFMYARLGMVSLTQVGLMGIGGWVLLRLNYAFNLPFEINLIVAGLVTMFFGMVLALPALRLRGLYLALVTLMAAGGLEIIFTTFQFPNGGTGFWGVQTGLSTELRRPTVALSEANYLRYTVFVTTLGFLLIEFSRRLAPGRAWALIRRSEAAALSAGVNVMRYKTLAFAVSGLVAGLAGALLAGSIGLLDGQTFRASESVMLFALAVVGGARYWLGVVIAAALFRIMPALLNNWGVDADLSYIIFGAGLLHAVITAPNGIVGQLHTALQNKMPRHTPSKQAVSITNFIDVSTDVSTTESRETAKVVSSVESQHTKASINEVSVHFGGVVALDAVDAKFTQAISGIIGPNGAGKTTLMNVFSGFVSVASGSIDIHGQLLASMTPHQRGQWGLRRSFQNEEIAEDLTVAENVMVQIDGLGLSATNKQTEVMRVLDIVGMSSNANSIGADLNRFERRLTDIAKCIVGHPKLIMLDEPAGGLSVQETAQLGSLILNIHKLTGAQTLVIDHDVDLIARICSETLVLDFGKRIAFGATAAVLADPSVKAAYLGTAEVV